MTGSILYGMDEVFSPFDPSVIHDLGIDKIAEKMDHEKSPFVEQMFSRKPGRPEDILFRLSCMEDLERPEVRQGILTFVGRVEKYRDELENSRKLPQRQTKLKWFLDAATHYCDSVLDLKASLARVGVTSEALVRFLKCLERHTETQGFVTLNRDARQCTQRLMEIRYTVEVTLNQNKVTVAAETHGPHETDDLLRAIVRKFQRYELSEGASIVPFPGVHMGTLETAILERLNLLFPDAFLLLEEFCRNHPAFDTALTDRFVEELQFYFSYLRYMNHLRERGYGFSYPQFTEQKSIRLEGGYDLVLAQDESARVSAGDFNREANQSFLITGPNHGGKTTYARMVGQILYLASLGLPVPCRSLQVYFLRGLFTHFAKNEDLSTNAGRLKEELLRVRAILDRMPDDSLVILNDLFASTTTYDARQMGKRILERLMAQGCLLLFVTHIGDLADDCPGLVHLYAAREEDAGAYVVLPAAAGRTTLQNQWLQRYRLRCEDIEERVKG